MIPSPSPSHRRFIELGRFFLFARPRLIQRVPLTIALSIVAIATAPGAFAREPSGSEAREAHASVAGTTAAARLPRQRRVAAAATGELPAESLSPAPAEHWYGWELGIADGGSLAILATGLALAIGNDGDGHASDDAAFTIVRVGIAGYLALAPALHVLHERPALRVLGSVGLRIALPLAGAGLGAAALSGCSSSDSWGTSCQAAGAGAGMLLGIVGAMVTDAALSFEPLEAEGSGSTTLRLTPALQVSRGRTLLGVGATF